MLKRHVSSFLNLHLSFRFTELFRIVYHRVSKYDHTMVANLVGLSQKVDSSRSVREDYIERDFTVSDMEKGTRADVRPSRKSAKFNRCMDARIGVSIQSNVICVQLDQ